MNGTLEEALDRLASAGYIDDFRATSGGLLARIAGTVHQPETLVIEDTVRFEGDSDPDEQVIIFALRSEEDGTRGTYTVVYGPKMEMMDARVVERLRTKTR